jgi:hypothetical protein
LIGATDDQGSGVQLDRLIKTHARELLTTDPCNRDRLAKLVREALEEPVLREVWNAVVCVLARLEPPDVIDTSTLSDAEHQPPLTGRLHFDRDTSTVTLDGKKFASLDPVAFRILEAIWAIRKEKGTVVSSKELRAFPGLQGKHITRELGKLPGELQAIIKSSPGAGRWIELPEKQ